MTISYKKAVIKLPTGKFTGVVDCYNGDQKVWRRLTHHARVKKSTVLIDMDNVLKMGRPSK